MFVLDTCWLIEAWTNVYPQAIFPSLWEQLRVAIESRRVVLLKPVVDEVKYPEDLKIWCSSHTTVNCYNDSSVVQALNTIADVLQREKATLLNSPKRPSTLTDAHIEQAIKNFSNGADIFLVAYAATHGGVIITLEKDHDKLYHNGQICLPYIARCCKVQLNSPIQMFQQLSFQC
ncbi:MAG: DUF4411 family protein [Synergistales bacterium]|nr:DUF4411 family protein [Synergistales bacterium]